MSLEPNIKKNVETGVFRFLANETLAKGVLELFDRVRTLENGCPDAKKEDLGPGPIQVAPPDRPMFILDLPNHIPGFTERIRFTTATLSRMATMEREGKIQGRMAQEITHLQDELHKSLTREQAKIQELHEATAHNADLMKRLDAALASIQDVHSILGTEIANEGIRLVAMRIKGERDEALQELANIDAVLGNRAIFDACKTRADKVALAIMFAKSAVGPLP